MGFPTPLGDGLCRVCKHPLFPRTMEQTHHPSMGSSASSTLLPSFLTPIYNHVQLQRLCATLSVSAHRQGSSYTHLSSLLSCLMIAQDRPEQFSSCCIVCSPYKFNGTRFHELLQLQSIVLDCWPATRSHPEEKGTLVHGLSYTWPLTKSHNASVRKGILTARDRNLCASVPSQQERNVSFQSS